MNVDARSQRSSESGWRDSRPPCVATGSPANLRPQSEKASRRIKVMRRHCRPANPRLIRRRCLLARSLASRIDNETERRKRRRCLASLTGHTILGGPCTRCACDAPREIVSRLALRPVVGLVRPRRLSVQRGALELFSGRRDVVTRLDLGDRLTNLRLQLGIFFGRGSHRFDDARIRPRRPKSR